ncbi:methyltransferase domain-containing protein [Paludisphaera mucosa]|uniref:Methyltransferase domain-containing protein n=1 Tax=Paludisphaera mucosa TaxID=3030827 RepID=A0ABT6F466_9BACT|nr:methyltransferase domain-containing protein [Paludisphaera mucosa]MDG3002376.1 methyltransferase domain-containing protein [Paludisphaera mucosa]
MTFLPDLRVRRRRPELMDQPGLDPVEHRRALAALRRVNGWSLTSRAVWPRIRDLGRARRRDGSSRPVRLLDLATGGGDLPIRLAQLARREGWTLEASGCDRSGFAVGHAAEQARRAGAEVAFFRHDVLTQPLPEGYDVLTCSLFLHHLDEPEAVDLLAAMGKSGALGLVDDLARSRAGWLLAYAGIRILSRSSVAHVDGPLSVEGAFTCEEARDLALKAGWTDPEVSPRWPCRFLLTGDAR